MQTPEVYRAEYPFKLETYFDGDPDRAVETWVPGVRWEEVCDGPHNDPYPYAECDGFGEVILTVVSRYKPPGYPTRVFYTRKWRDPHGKEFGNGKLFCVTVPAFRRRAKGWWLSIEYVLSDRGKSLWEDAA